MYMINHNVPKMYKSLHNELNFYRCRHTGLRLSMQVHTVSDSLAITNDNQASHSRITKEKEKRRRDRFRSSYRGE